MKKPLYEIVNFPTFKDRRGFLTFIERSENLPFPFERIYYIYDVPEKIQRAGHAHKTLRQVIIPLAGRFTIELNNGEFKEKVKLNGPAKGVHISPMTWIEISDFSKDAVCLVWRVCAGEPA